MRNSRIRNTVKVSDLHTDLREKAGLTALAVLTVAFILKNSVLVRDYERLFNIIVLAACVFFAADTIIDIFKGNKRITLITLILFAAVIVISFCSGKRTVAIIFVALIEASRFRPENIAFTVSVSIFTALFAVVLSSVAGIIENVDFSADGRTRYGLGFVWATVGASSFLFASLGWLYYRKRRITYAEIAAVAGGSALFFFFTDSRLAFGLTLAVAITALLIKIFGNKLSVVFPKKKRARIMLSLVPLAVVLITALSVGLYAAGVPFFKELNVILSNRLALSVRAFSELDITVFGENINWRGWDETTINAAGYDYFYVDNAYMKTLFDFGVIGFIITVMGYSFAIYRSLKKEDFLLSAGLIAVCLHASLAPSLLSFPVNVVLFALAPFTVDSIFYSEEFSRRTCLSYGKITEKDRADFITDNSQGKTPLISVVIPVYNVEKYLGRCLDSIVGQTYRNLEIILVNDGSIDASYDICKEYAQKDKRIRIISRENRGVSASRNEGVSVATGKYLAFIDSDDAVSSDYIEYMYITAEKEHADFSACEVVSVRNDVVPALKPDYYESFYKVLDSERALKSLLYDDGLFLSAGGKLFLTSFIKRYEFPEDKVYEDTAVIYKWINGAKLIACGQKVCYYYMLRENSISTSVAGISEKEKQYEENTREMLDFVSDNYPSLEKAVRRFELYYRFRLLRISWISENGEEERLWQEIKKYRCRAFFDNDLSLRDRLAIASAFFGKKFFRFSRTFYGKLTGRNGLNATALKGKKN
ncbi:MAG: glycosyltransferase [Clostridia bacterium]|nr:glycosyltransferase [Clostridia bacterium]